MQPDAELQSMKPSRHITKQEVERLIMWISPQNNHQSFKSLLVLKIGLPFLPIPISCHPYPGLRTRFFFSSHHRNPWVSSLQRLSDSHHPSSHQDAYIIHQFSMGVYAFSPYESPSIQSRKSLKCGESPRGKSFAPKSAGRSPANHAGSGVPSEAPGSSSPSWWAFSFRNRRIFVNISASLNEWKMDETQPKNHENKHQTFTWNNFWLHFLSNDWYNFVTNSPWDLVIFLFDASRTWEEALLPIGWITAGEQYVCWNKLWK